MDLITSPLIRLSKTPNAWVCSFINSPHLYLMNDKVAGFIVLGMDQQWKKESLINEMVKISGFPQQKIENLIQNLLKKKILCQEIEKDDEKLTEIIRKYEKYGWKSAAEYHFSSFDYKFIDYETSEGYRLDDQRMQKFFEEGKEIPRFKSYPTAKKLACRSPDKVEFSSLSNKNLNFDFIQDLLSFSIGKIREGVRVTKFGEPLMHKVVPSGGARHPTEAYLLAQDIEGLENNTYHFDADKYRLEILNKSISISDLEKLFFPARSFLGFIPKAVIILTSIFERNMFRYREPRTFRAVHMDAGHIIKVMETLLERENLLFRVQYNMNEKGLAKFLELSTPREGIMAAIAIGNN